MNRRFQQLILCYLALCLALAGGIGISPDWHRLIEHGGNGPAHTHRGGLARADESPHWHDDGDGRLHRHTHPEPRAESPLAKRLFSHQREFGLPKIQFGALWRSFAKLFGADSGQASNSPDHGPSHRHFSLPQLMAGGLVEQHLDVPLLERPLYHFPFCAKSAGNFFLVADWDRQTAPRGPPRA